MSEDTFVTIEELHGDIADVRRRIKILQSINRDKDGSDLELEYELWQIGQPSCRFVTFTVFASWIMVSIAHVFEFARWGSDLGTLCNTTSSNTNTYVDNSTCLTNTEEIYLLYNVFVAGSLGGILSGILCDVCGRLFFHRLMIPFHICFSFTILFTTSAVLGVICRFVIVLSSFAMLVCCFALLIDYCSLQTRSFFGMLFFSYASLGYTALGAAMGLTSVWRRREALWFFFNEIVLASSGLFLPESARLLAAQNIKAKSWGLVRKMIGAQASSLEVVDEDDEEDLSPIENFKNAFRLLAETFKDLDFVVRIILLCIPGFLLNPIVVRYPDRSLSEQITDEFYMYEYVIALITFCGALVGILLSVSFGRKFTIIFSTLISAFAFLIARFMDDHSTASTTLLLLGRINVQTSFAGILIMAAETFPTVCRGTATGVIITTHLFGGMIFYPIDNLLESPYNYVLAIVFHFLAAFAIIFVPSTRRRYIYDTYDEAVYYKEISNERPGFQNALIFFDRKIQSV